MWPDKVNCVVEVLQGAFQKTWSESEEVLHNRKWWVFSCASFCSTFYDNSANSSCFRREVGHNQPVITCLTCYLQLYCQLPLSVWYYGLIIYFNRGLVVIGHEWYYTKGFVSCVFSSTVNHKRKQFFINIRQTRKWKNLVISFLNQCF